MRVNGFLDIINQIHKKKNVIKNTISTVEIFVAVFVAMLLFYYLSLVRFCSWVLSDIILSHFQLNSLLEDNMYAPLHEREVPSLTKLTP